MGTSAVMGVASLVIFVLLLVVPLAGGVVLIVLGARRRGKGYPACGQCGYDVSGTLGTVNARCPECGGDFGVVGILPASTARNKGMIFGGVALILVPLMCFGAMLFPAMTSVSRARMAAQQARASAMAAQAAAVAQQTQQESNASYLAGAPTTDEVVPWRERIKGWESRQVDDRLQALWLDLGSDAAADPVKLAELRAELQALSERAVDNAPQHTRDYIASPLTQSQINAMTADQLQQALSQNSFARQFGQRHAVIDVRLKAEFDALMAALRTIREGEAKGNTP